MARTRHPDDLRSIPGVGPAIAADLRRLGVRRTTDLAGRDPQELYERLEGLDGGHVDRCVLYVFRAAVHHAGGASGDPELAKWWNWKDGGLAERLGLVWEQRAAAPERSAQRGGAAPEPQAAPPLARPRGAAARPRRSSRTPPGPGRRRSSRRG